MLSGENTLGEACLLFCYQCTWLGQDVLEQMCYRRRAMNSSLHPKEHQPCHGPRSPHHEQRLQSPDQHEGCSLLQPQTRSSGSLPAPQHELCSHLVGYSSGKVTEIINFGTICRITLQIISHFPLILNLRFRKLIYLPQFSHPITYL